MSKDPISWPSKHVIHTVGPIYAAHEEGENAALLASCYRESLKLAAQNNLRSIVRSWHLD